MNLPEEIDLRGLARERRDGRMRAAAADLRPGESLLLLRLSLALERASS